MRNILKLFWRGPHRSFAAKLTFVMILLVASTMIAVTFITVRIVNDKLTDQIGGTLEAQATDVNDLVHVFLEGKVSQVQVLATEHSIVGSIAQHNASYAGGDEDALAEIQALDERWIAADDDDPLLAGIIDPDGSETAHRLAEFLDSFPDHSEVFVTDRLGATVAATGRLSDYYQADEDWWQSAWNDGNGAVYISDPEFDESAGVTALLIAVPLVDHETNEVIGVARSTLDVGGLSAIVGNVRFGQTGHAMLLGRPGQMLFDALTVDDDGHEHMLPADLQRQAALGASGFEIARTPEGKESIFGFAPLSESFTAGQSGDLERQSEVAISELGWSAVVTQEKDEAFAVVSAIQRGTLAAGLAVVVVAALLALLVARAVTRPITMLANAADRVGAGDLNVPIPQAGADEVGRLSGSFEKMTVHLRDIIGSLEGSTAELSKTNRELRDVRAQAATDGLTGLSNHRTFYERIEAEASRAQVSRRPVGLIMLDIDNFKSVNDSQGHWAGDNVLRQLAAALVDVAGQENAYRYGGDEFAILLPGTDHEKTLEIAERLRRALENRPGADGVTVSLGVASFPAAASVEELVYGADIAMYWAKSEGKNRVADWARLVKSRTGGALPWFAADGAVQAPEVVVALGEALAAKDPSTRAHTERCSSWAVKVSQELGLKGVEASTVRLASFLHDVGKLAVPDEILFKPGPLNEEEWAQMKQHPTAGLQILGQIRSLTTVTPSILHHHEHFDGSGYPDGLAGEEIPIASRILLVTDAFDAMTNDRTYRKAMPVEAAVKELTRHSGSQFDPAVVDAFLSVLTRERNQPQRWTGPLAATV